jgi:two-component system, chemotaxis family, sensor kinase CheA
MNEETTFSGLVTMLGDFSPGDLVGSLEIAEAAEQLGRREDNSDEVKRLCTAVKDFFTAVVKEGADDSAAETAATYAEQLKKVVPAEEKSDGEKQTRPAGEDDSDYEVLVSFIQEAQDHLENIEEEILRLEDGNDPVVVNNIFRSMHTIKGVSSFIGLNKIKELSHSLESVLDQLRMNEIEIGTDLIDLLLAGSDMLLKMVQELDMKAHARREGKGGGEGLDSEMDIRPITDALDHVKEKAADTGGPGREEELITPEMIENFTAESQILLSDVEEILKKLQADPDNTDILTNAFGLMHTIKGNAGFFGFTTTEQVCMNIESVVDQLRKGEQEYSDSVIDVLFDSLKAIKDTLHNISEGKEENEGLRDKPLGEALVEIGGVSRAAVEQALELQQRKLGEILIDGGKVQPDVVEKALSQQQKLSGQAGGGAAVQRMDIRVDTEKLDKLFDLMGELITTEAMVIDNPELEEHNLNTFYLDASNLSKITREMQEITMAIRMIPLEGLFNKMRRLVRDLSRKFDKNVNLVISGQETEMDRNVMEEISDPLVHIIRNAIDHGIEKEEQRTAAGKDAAGTIWLDAKYEGNEIWITVKDNGKGLHREKILEKAKAHGLVSGDTTAVPDKEVWPLIFEPGFSTAEQVSEISGRGVGMDVVKRNIEKLRGKVDVTTVTGQGSEFVLRIPLTLAIIDGITLTVGKMMYTIPISDIISFHKIEPEQLTETRKGSEVLNLRGEIFPVIKLWDVLKIDTDKREVTDGIVIIVVSDNRQAAILVDEIIGNKQVVIKALPEEMGDMEGVSGCSIMGNGEVSLIIDTNSLIQRVLD